MMLDPLSCYGFADEPRPIMLDWKGHDLYEGQDYWRLDNGDIVQDDIASMDDYLFHRMEVSGGVAAWVKDDLEEGTLKRFIIQMINDGDNHQALGLTDIFEDYYGGVRRTVEVGDYD